MGDIVPSCLGCRHLLDATCPYHRAIAYFHRLADCVAPIWPGLISQLHDTTRNATTARGGGGGGVCVLGQRSVLWPYMSALGVSRDVRFVDVTAHQSGGSAPVANLHDIEGCARLELPIRQRWLPEARGYVDHGLCAVPRTQCTRHPPASGQLLRALHASTRAALASSSSSSSQPQQHQQLRGGEEPRPVLLITRRGASVTSTSLQRNGTRAFAAEALAALRARLRRLRPPSVVIEYSGHEDVRSTVALFSRARAVVGVHGAGHANVLFALSSRVAVVELSTWLDAARSVPWRSNGGVLSRWSTAIEWRTHRLPTEAFIASARERAAFYALKAYKGPNSRDLFLTTVSSVAVPAADVASVAEWIERSWSREEHSAAAETGHTGDAPRPRATAAVATSTDRRSKQPAAPRNDLHHRHHETRQLPLHGREDHPGHKINFKKARRDHPGHAVAEGPSHRSQA